MSEIHCNFDMIVAKSENADLVVFTQQDKTEWEEIVINDDGMPLFDPVDHFLCLPQHKEVCLHWLNGEQVQQSPLCAGQWDDSDINRVWKTYHPFMKDELEFRIKPKE